MIARLLLIGFVSFMVYIVYCADQGALPEVISFHNRIPYGDALGHFCLMGMFAFLAIWVTEARMIKFLGLRLPVGGVVVFIIVILEELSQIFIDTRTFSLIDLSADVLGICAFGCLAFRLFHVVENTDA